MKVTDPSLLAQLEGDGGKVTDPGLLQQLEATPDKVSTARAALGGAASGATLGWGDEMEAGWKSLFPKAMGGGDYGQLRDQIRGRNDNERSQHPWAYGAGEAAGSALPAVGMALATGGTSLAPALAKAALPLAAGQGAVQGAGLSDADSAGGVARDASIGGGLGVAGHFLGTALGSAGGALARWARGRATQAVAKAAEKAAGEVEAGVASARGSLGGEVQKGQRIVENLRRLGPELSPEQQALVEQLEKRLTESTLEALPAQAGTIAAKDAELAAAKSGASEAFNTRKADLLSGAEVGKQLKARLLRYGPPAVMGALGTLAGGPAGSAVGAVAGIAARPAFQSMRRLAQNPAVQNAAFTGIADAAESPGAQLIRQLLAKGVPVPVIQRLVAE